MLEVEKRMYESRKLQKAAMKNTKAGEKFFFFYLFKGYDTGQREGY